MVLLCAVCVSSSIQSAFHAVDDLEAHIIGFHFNFRPFECSYCILTRFPTENELKTHYNNVHNLRNFKVIYVHDSTFLDKRPEIEALVDRSIKLSDYEKNRPGASRMNFRGVSTAKNKERLVKCSECAEFVSARPSHQIEHVNESSVVRLDMETSLESPTHCNHRPSSATSNHHDSSFCALPVGSFTPSTSSLLDESGHENRTPERRAASGGVTCKQCGKLVQNGYTNLLSHVNKSFTSMPLISVCSSSSSSGDHGVPVFDAEEVGKRLQLDRTTIDLLKKEPANNNNLILVLSYQNAFLNIGSFEINKQAVSTALTNLGATLVSDNVFKFDDWPTMYAARKNMKMTMRWCFYTTDPVWAQQLNISQQPTITTTAITWCPEITGELTIYPYEFFEV